jgi:hypothetical protein
VKKHPLAITILTALLAVSSATFGLLGANALLLLPR